MMHASCAYVGIVIGSACNRSILSKHWSAEMSAFFRPSTVLTGQADELSRCPGNGPASVCQAVWKHKRCWTPALDFHRKQIPGQSPCARWCFLSKALGNSHLSSFATLTRGNLRPSLPDPALHIRESHPKYNSKAGNELWL